MNKKDRQDEEMTERKNKKIISRITSVLLLPFLILQQVYIANAGDIKKAAKDARASYLRPAASRQPAPAHTASITASLAKLQDDIDVSIIIPSRARSDRLLETIDRVIGLPLSKEILVVVDGIDKADPEVVNQILYLQAKGVKILIHPTNRGKGACIKTALTAAKGKVVITQDADLEYGPEDIPNVIKPILEGKADVVYGSRFLKPGIPDDAFGSAWENITFHFQAWVLRMIIRILFGVDLTDETSGHKAYRREALEQIQQRGERFEWESEITAKLLRLGHKIYEVPIHYRLRRAFGEGKSFKRIDQIRTIWTLLKYRVMPRKRFYISPPDEKLLGEVRSVVLKAMYEAAKLALNYRVKITELQTESKEDTTIVTEADRVIQRCIVDTIRKYFPQHRILAEESSEDIAKINEKNYTSPYAWAIDPLDGTLEFMNPQSNYYAISIGLLYKGSPIAGFVFAPEFEMMGHKGILFEAVKGKGAFITAKNTRLAMPKLPQITAKELKTANTVITDITPIMSNWRTVFGEISGENKYKIKSAALTLCRVAASGLSRENPVLLAQIKPGTPKIWDFAAGSLILQEVGGVIVDLDNKPIFPMSNELLLKPQPYCTHLIAGAQEAVNAFIERNKRTKGLKAEDINTLFADVKEIFLIYSSARRAKFIEGAFGGSVYMDILKRRLGILFSKSTYPEDKSGRRKAGSLSTEQARIEIFSKVLSVILNPERPDRNEVIDLLQQLLSVKAEGLLPEARKLISSYLTICKQQEPLLITMAMPVFSGVRMLPQEENPRGEDALRRAIVQLEQLTSVNSKCAHWQLIIVDDGSRGKMAGQIAERILNEYYPEYLKTGKVKVKYIEDVLQEENLSSADDSRKGGAVIYGLKEALREAEQYKEVFNWRRQYVGYMDSDSKEISSQLGLLLDGFSSDDIGIAFGSRRLRDSQAVNRTFLKAKLSSSVYNMLVKLLLHLSGVYDTQCGFKLMSREAAQKVVYLSKDKRFSFDTELLLLLKNAGYRHKEVPIVFIDSPATTIQFIKDVPDMLRGIVRQRRHHMQKTTSGFVSTMVLASINLIDTLLRLVRFTASVVLIATGIERFESKARSILRDVMQSGTRPEVWIGQYLLLARASKLESSSLTNRIRALWRLRDLYFAVRANEALRFKALEKVFDVLDNKTKDEDLWKNAKEILTEMLESPYEEIWKPAFKRSITALKDPKEKESWIAVIEAAIPVRGGLENKNMVSSLIELLQDPSVFVKEASAFILGEMQPKHVDAESYLLAALEREKTESVREVMMDAFNKIKMRKETPASKKVAPPYRGLRTAKEITQIMPRAATGLQDMQCCDETGRLKQDYEFYQRFAPSRFFTNPIDVYVRRKDAKIIEKILIKGGNEYTVWSEYISQRFFALLGLPVPKISLVKVPLRDRFGNFVHDSSGEIIETTAMAIEYLEDYKGEGLWLAEEFYNEPSIQGAVLLSILLAERDRSPKNILFKTTKLESDKPPLYHIDFGASIISRATGGLTSFSFYLSRIEMQKLLHTTRFDQQAIVNEAYMQAVKNWALLRRLALCIKAISDEQIKAIVDSAGIPKGKESISQMKEWIEQLQAENEPGNWNRKPRTPRNQAIETLRSAIRAGGLDKYIQKSLMWRRDDIAKIIQNNNPWQSPIKSTVREMPQPSSETAAENELMAALTSEQRKNSVVVTIDGPSGAGKTTVAKNVAKELGALYISYGKYYRLLTWLALEQGINLGPDMKKTDMQRVIDLANVTDFSRLSMVQDDIDNFIYDDENITSIIFSPRIADNVAFVSQIPQVRGCIVKQLKKIVETEKAKGHSVVLEGRVTGIELAQDADAKIFLTADLDLRARRRADEFIRKKGLAVTYRELFKIGHDAFKALLREKGEDYIKQQIIEAVIESIQKRDQRDRERKHMPATIALDAITIDSTQLAINETSKVVIDEIHKAIENKNSQRPKIKTVEDLNRCVGAGKLASAIKEAEEAETADIVTIAKKISTLPERSVVLIAGGSSSGKTTLTNRLIETVKKSGKRAVVLHTDNYFKNYEEMPLAEDGRKDFDSPNALDVPLLNQHLKVVTRGGSVPQPIYIYDEEGHGMRAKETVTLKLEKDEILFVEGTLCLHRDIISGISLENRYCIMITTSPKLHLTGGASLSSEDLRLIRRAVRDDRERGYSAVNTIRQWPLVVEGEMKYIQPTIEQANLEEDTALIYELAVLKKPFLCALAKSYKEALSDLPTLKEIHRLIKLLEGVPEVSDKDIPADSILREFIGGDYSVYNIDPAVVKECISDIEQAIRHISIKQRIDCNIADAMLAAA